MSETAAPAGSATESSATPFESDIGEMFGDYSAGTPEPDESAAGTTPAEPASGTETDPASGSAAVADGQTALASEGTTPDAQASAPAVVDDDPFKDTTPATYMVNGRAVPVEDIRVFKEGGAVIRPESLPNILSKLAERETLSEQSRTVKQQYDTLSKVSEWHDQASGKTYTGPDAAIELRVGNAALFAENKLLVDTLSDPDKLYRILTTEQIPDGKGGIRERVILNPAALRDLQRENALQQRELSAAIRDHYKGVLAEATKPQSAPLDFNTEAPRLVALVAQSANLDPSVLTAEDKAVLAEQMPFHIKDGQVSVQWQNLAKRMMQDRAAQKASTQQIVTSTTQAARVGAANLAAAARGVKQPARPATPQQRQPTPNQNRRQNESELWDQIERSQARAVRSNA